MISGEAALFHFPAQPSVQCFPDLITRNCHWSGPIPLILLSCTPPFSARDEACRILGGQLHAKPCSMAKSKILFRVPHCLNCLTLTSVLIDFQRLLKSAFLLILQMSRCTVFRISNVAALLLPNSRCSFTYLELSIYVVVHYQIHFCQSFDIPPPRSSSFLSTSTLRL